MAQSVGSYSNPLKKFKLVFLGEQSGMYDAEEKTLSIEITHLTKSNA